MSIYFAITKVVLIAFINPKKQFGAQFEKTTMAYMQVYIYSVISNGIISNSRLNYLK